MRKLPTATEAALLIALLVKRKERELGKEMVRNRISEKSLRRITGRRRVDRHFIYEMNELLRDFNLLLLDTGNALGLLQSSSVLGWPRITSNRIAKEIEEAESGELDFRCIENDLEQSRAAPDEERDSDE
jgi:hypothetical protein